MAAIRGINSHFPCPTCLVPKDKLSSLSSEFPLRTTETMEAVYTSVEGATVGERNEALKAVGLRNVKVCHYFQLAWQRPPEWTLTICSECVLGNPMDRRLLRHIMGPSSRLPWRII
jgi:hypothetical protein